MHISVAVVVNHGADRQEERRMRIGLLTLVLAAALMSPGASAEIRVASWNLNNLHHELDEPLRPGAPARTEAEIEVLRKYRDRAEADIFALQEVNGPTGRSAGLSHRAVGSVLLRPLRR